ncbi:MAG: hypothetical protein L6W00_24770 [Lentisphaeria bacterium]|nr:MAG: hypothetical protein L6W00_24770 [Lentisphaeria bacterium]
MKFRLKCGIGEGAAEEHGIRLFFQFFLLELLIREGWIEVDQPEGVSFDPEGAVFRDVEPRGQGDGHDGECR